MPGSVASARLDSGGGSKVGATGARRSRAGRSRRLGKGRELCLIDPSPYDKSSHQQAGDGYTGNEDNRQPQSSLGFRESRRGGLPRGRIRSRHDHLVTPVGRHDRRRIARCKDFVACERGDLKLRLSQRRRTNQLARRTLIGLRGRRYFAEQRTQLINRQSTGGGAERFATGAG